MGRVLALCLTQGVPREHTCFIPKTKSSVLMLICFALALVMSLLALAQEATKPGEMKQDSMKAEKASAKAVSLSGKISADGKTFGDNKSWTVSNPEALKGHEGHEVKLKVHEDAAKNEIHVVSVKMAKGEMKESTNKR